MASPDESWNAAAICQALGCPGCPDCRTCGGTVTGSGHTCTPRIGSLFTGYGGEPNGR